MPPTADGERPTRSRPSRRPPPKPKTLLDSVLWEVVRDANGKAVHSVDGTDPVTKAAVTGQEVVFKTTAKSGVVVTKTFRLLPNTDGLEVELKFESPDKERSVVYNLLGPHGIPIEGEWYTGTFRDVVFGQLNGQRNRDCHPRGQRRRRRATDSPIDNTALPLVFAGVENQYFAILIEPNPTPDRRADRWDSKTIALVLHKDEKAPQKSDVGVRISSKPFTDRSQPSGDAQLPRFRRAQDGRCSRALSLPRGWPSTARTSGSRLRRRHRTVRHHADPAVYLRRDRASRAPVRPASGKLRHRDHPADAARCAG